MRRYFLLLAVFLLCGGWTHGVPTPPAAVSCNFVTGVATGIGAGTCVSVLPTCDGATNTEASFTAFNTWATTTWQGSHTGLIELYIPPGTNCSLTTFNVTMSGIKKLRVSGYGATLSGAYFHIGGDGQYQDDLHSTRLLTASVGATSVTVNPTAMSQPAACSTIAGCTGLFSVGGWALIAGFDLQSGTGFPSNPAYFQYVHITAINSSTGIISFDAPLADTYLSTWPNYNKGNGAISQPDDGGPVTLYVFKPGWDTEIEWRGVTFTSDTQLDEPGREVVFRDCIFTQSAAVQKGLAPTQNLSLQINNTTMTTTSMEFDKMVNTALISGVTINQLGFQSANKNVTVNNSTVLNFVGTPANLTVTNSTITGDLKAGPQTYGRSNTLTVTNSAIASVGDGSAGNASSHANFGAHFAGNTSGSTGFQNIPGLSVSSGVIGIPNAYIQLHASDLNVMGWAMPGTNSCWGYDTNDCASTFQIQGVTQDGSGNYSTAVTISNASPAVVGYAAHGRAAGDVVSFSGTLPSPLVAGTLYYVIATGLTANAFEISATLGGSAINTTTSGSGTFTIATGKTYIATNMLGGVLPTVSSGDLTIRNVPNTASYFTNCSVSLDCIGLNAASAQGKPLGSYSKRTYTNANTGGAAPYWPIFGNLQKLNITVNTAYTGSLSATITPNTLFGTYLTSAGAGVSYVPAIVNTKVGGARVLDASGGYPATWSGAQSGDTLNPIAASRFATTSFRSVSDDISSDPSHPMSVTVEVITDMQLVIP